MSVQYKAASVEQARAQQHESVIKPANGSGRLQPLQEIPDTPNPPSQLRTWSPGGRLKGRRPFAVAEGDGNRG
ncbi:hypothetical protein ACIQ9E_23125, partial [Streptomyces sp. NPDC094448]|uniref:hypothetical protein n=1 Tax=Streptomyces sp. NPDC094448 TaxID=3366063 RepID=UPI00380657B7